MSSRLLFPLVLPLLACLSAPAADLAERSWPWLPVDRTADETVWRNIESSAEYVEFASGLNFLNEVGQWEDSREEIVLLPEGDAAALKGQHRVFFSPNLNSTGAIQFLSREGRPYVSHPLGLYYFCAATGRSARVASVQDSIGELLPPNQILYRDAFLGSNVRGDIRFTYTKAGFESDAILSELPEPETFGFDGQNTRLEIWWAFTDPPEPERQVRVLKSREAGRDSMVEPDLVDETLDFGDVWFPQGKAFAAARTAPSGEPARIDLPGASDDDQGSIHVGKQWLEIDGTRVMIESVDWLDAVAHLERVSSAATFAGLDPKSQVNPRRVLDGGAPRGDPAQTIRLASAPYRESGLVIDYISVNPSGSYTFNSGQTYYVSSSGYLGGTVTFGAGCVIKFASNAYLLMYGPVVCNGGALKSILTSKDDDLYGEPIAGSTGNPTYTAQAPAWIYYPPDSTTLSYMQIRWATTGIRYSGSGSPTHWLNWITLEQCQTGLSVNYSTISLYGVIGCGLGTPLSADENSIVSGSIMINCNGDTDSDGLPDSWETTYFGNITSQNGTGDPDGDGLNNYKEYLLGTNPNSANVDTDGDGLADGYDPNRTTLDGPPTLAGATFPTCPQ